MPKAQNLKDVKKLKFRSVSPKEMNSFMEDASISFQKILEEEEKIEARRWKPKTEIIGTCRCKGKIVIHTTFHSEYNPMSGPPIIGPGSKGQFHKIESTECFCQKCGIVYNSNVVKKQK